MRDTRYLLKRHGTWFARVTIPRPLQAAAGRAEIVRTLRTGDLKTAQDARWAVIADLKAYVGLLRADPSLGSQGTPEEVLHRARATAAAAAARTKPEVILADAAAAADAVRAGELDQATALQALDQSRWDTATDLDPEGLRLTGPIAEAFTQAERILADPNAVPLSSILDKHIAAVQGALRKKTIKTRIKVVKTLIEFLRDPMITDTSRKDVGRYVVDYLIPLSIAPKTKRDWISDISAVFAWARTAGYIDTNPTEGTSTLIKVTSRGVEKEDERRAWTDEELRSLFAKMTAQLKPSDYMHRLVKVAIYSGLRLNELCELKGRDIEDDCIIVREAKNANSLRRVPIHSALLPLMSGIKADQFVIPGLVSGGYDDRRGFYASKRFSKLKIAWGFDSDLVFHGFRRCFAEKLEAAGVPLSTAEMLLGHRRSSMTYGHYSKQLPPDTLKQAVESVAYSL